MSLKAIHLLFIIVSTLLCFGFAAWCFWTYSESEVKALSYVVMGGLSVASGLGLMVYGRYFLKKLKDVSYL